MSARNHYDEDFKRTPSLNFTTTVKLNPRSLKSIFDYIFILLHHVSLYGIPLIQRLLYKTHVLNGTARKVHPLQTEPRDGRSGHGRFRGRLFLARHGLDHQRLGVPDQQPAGDREKNAAPDE